MIEIRWGVWLKAAFFYAHNFEKLEDFITQLDDDSLSVSRLTKVIPKERLKEDLVDLCKFKFLVAAITSL